MRKELYYDYDEYVKNHFAFVRKFNSYIKNLANSLLAHQFFHVEKAPKIVDYKFHKHEVINFNNSQSSWDYFRTKGFTTEMFAGLIGDMLQKERSWIIDKP